ncbi:hypothetical protein FACS1894188_00390 [Clostridia bacterium]|nr:hypothetical protein FACS1894188_00390 [Clostridia bacterium]
MNLRKVGLSACAVFLLLSACAKKPAPAPAPKEPPKSIIATVADGADTITFEDGNTSFLLVDTSPADSTGVDLAVVDKNGSKMLKIEKKGAGVPYVALDASSLLGERIVDLRKLEFNVYTEHPDGEFYAVSGGIFGYSGAERLETEKNWSVYLDYKNPNVGTYAMTRDFEYMIPDNFNFFVLTLETDNGDTDGKNSAVVYLDNIRFLDAEDNVLPIDTSVSFNAPDGFGSVDVSNLYAVSGEKNIPLAGASDGGWGQAASVMTIKNDGGVLDPALLVPNSVVTVFYSSASAPELILQSWTDGKPESAGWAKVAPFVQNNSGSIAQYKYADIVAAFGTDKLADFLDQFYIGDTGNALHVSKVTIGAGDASSPYVPVDRSNLTDVNDETDLGMTGSSGGGFGQAAELMTIKNDGGTFDPAQIGNNTIFTVYYVSQSAPEMIFQSWTDNAPPTAGWAKVPPSYVNDSGTIAQFTYAGIVETFGTDNFKSFLDKFYIGDSGATLKVAKVTIGNKK